MAGNTPNACFFHRISATEGCPVVKDNDSYAPSDNNCLLEAMAVGVEIESVDDKVRTHASSEFR